MGKLYVLAYVCNEAGESEDPRTQGGRSVGPVWEKFGHKIGGVGRKVRIGTDLPRNGQNLFGQALKNKKNPPKIPGDRMG